MIRLPKPSPSHAIRILSFTVPQLASISFGNSHLGSASTSDDAVDETIYVNRNFENGAGAGDPSRSIKA